MKTILETIRAREKRDEAIVQAVCTLLMVGGGAFTAFFLGMGHPAAPIFAFGPALVGLGYFVWRNRRRKKTSTGMQWRNEE